MGLKFTYQENIEMLLYRIFEELVGIVINDRDLSSFRLLFSLHFIMEKYSLGGVDQGGVKVLVVLFSKYKTDLMMLEGVCKRLLESSQLTQQIY